MLSAAMQANIYVSKGDPVLSSTLRRGFVLRGFEPRRQKVLARLKHAFLAMRILTSIPDHVEELPGRSHDALSSRINNETRLRPAISCQLPARQERLAGVKHPYKPTELSVYAGYFVRCRGANIKPVFYYIQYRDMPPAPCRP